MNGEARRKLPVWRTAGESYRTAFRNWRYAIRISWAWLPVLVALAATLQIVNQPVPVERASDGDVALRMLGTFPAMLAYFLVLSSIAVAWHRKLLREEIWPRLAYLRLDMVVGRYWLYSLLVLLIGFLVMLVLLLIVIAVGIGLFFLIGPLPSSEVALSIGAALFGIPLVFLMVLLLFRLSLLLPGIALEEQRLSPRTAWRHTRGNTWRIFLGMLLCWLPPAAVLGFLSYTIVAGPLFELRLQPSLSLAFVLLVIVDQVTNLLMGFIGLSFLALAYRFFFEPERLPQQDAAL